MAVPARMVRVKLARKVEYSNPIQVAAGAKVRVGRDCSAGLLEDARHNWLLVRNAQGERGWIPARCASSR